MGHSLAKQRFCSYEDVKKWFDECFPAKGEDFYCLGILKLPVRWGKCIASDGALLEEIRCFLPKCFFKEKNPHLILVHLVVSFT